MSVCLREGGRGWCKAVAREGEAGGVWVDARGRVLEGLASSRGSSSEAPLECRCRLRRKLKPRRPDGRLVEDMVDIAVAAVVGAAGAGAVYITAAAKTRMQLCKPEAYYPGGCVNGVSTTFDRGTQHGQPVYTPKYEVQCSSIGEQRSGAARAIRTAVVMPPSKRLRSNPLELRALVP